MRTPVSKCKNFSFLFALSVMTSTFLVVDGDFRERSRQEELRHRIERECNFVEVATCILVKLK